MNKPNRIRMLLLSWAIVSIQNQAAAQLPMMQIGDAVPRDVREMYDKGLRYLATTQSEDGDWNSANQMGGTGITGLALMAFLASGEDPNFGLYSSNIQRGLRSLISHQDSSTGFIGGQAGHASMYNHGFAMLALAEAYGAVDETTLWRHGTDRQPTIGQTLELAVRLAITSQKKNQYGGWRYGPDARDADTSVTGAVMVGLLAARNAGIEVPDDAIDRGIAYLTSMTSNSGNVAYSGVGGGHSKARVAIGTLVYAIAQRKDLPQFKATLDNLVSGMDSLGSSHLHYSEYYEAQALFQGDVEAWKQWNESLIERLKSRQASDGSFDASYGPAYGTAMSLLAMALNFRFLPIYER